ncbi:polysaccharide deacetylase family protein [Nocardioides sp. zg-1228]|uniref:polysaccharide deacetylase family protein n=1 Tax=Nocardioides sp. zg-1228 TaxID=2763008 RepID=UPI0016426DD2|nr:polysaccharide deacetylase family protein [Nocardioides sp. zg-1228]MBC2932869.1 polysaccharide deacetylase family protein [Nocardioides sp. zg-1228]QSF56921.1 polysaccharide deacetylase family protein [Nocardioides sp. zg-1228]
MSDGFVPGGATAPTAVPIEAARGTGRVAALTFDDGPDPRQTGRLLDVLAELGVTATFCVVGQRVRAPGGAELLRRIVAEGHALGNHSLDYADLGSATEEEAAAVLLATLRIIREALGDPDAAVPWYRAPNGSFGRTGQVAASLGMQPLGLGNVIHDWDDCDDRSVATLADHLRAAIAPGAVVLAHDGGGDRATTVDAVALVVAEKVADGFHFTLPRGGAEEHP